MESSEKYVDLAETLGQLKIHAPQSFEEFCTMFLGFNFIDFDNHFRLSGIIVKQKEFMSVPVFRGKFIAELLLWGPDTCTPIYDHHKFDMRIKVLKGLLTEVLYRENENFIEYDGVFTSLPGHVFPQKEYGIHSMINGSGGSSVSLHLYNTTDFVVSDFRLFDTALRKVFKMSGNSDSYTWYQADSLTDEVVKTQLE